MRSFLNRVYKDLRQGENLDLYLTFIIAVSLVALDLLEFSPEGLASSLLLTVLALLALSGLGNRYRLDQILARLEARSTDFFLQDFTSEFQAEIYRNIETAADLLLIGGNLERTLKLQYPALEQRLLRGQPVRVVLVDPRGSGPEIIAKRDYQKEAAEFTRNKIAASLDSLVALRNSTGGQLHINVVNDPLSHGTMMFDADSPKGEISIWYYTYGAHATNRPKLILRPRDSYWYLLYAEEAEAVWSASVPWPGTMTP